MHHMTKFSIIISQGGMHRTRRNAIISQKFMDKEEYKNFLVTIHNLSLHSFISMKFSFGCDHIMRNVAILSRTSASNNLLRGSSSSPNLWI
jgi:hypothetical protein